MSSYSVSFLGMERGQQEHANKHNDGPRGADQSDITTSTPTLPQPNSWVQNPSGLIFPMERAKGFEPSTLTLAGLLLPAASPLEGRSGHSSPIGSCCSNLSRWQMMMIHARRVARKHSEGSVATLHGWRLTLDAERTPWRLPLQKLAQACIKARRLSKLSVRR